MENNDAYTVASVAIGRISNINFHKKETGGYMFHHFTILMLNQPAMAVQV